MSSKKCISLENFDPDDLVFDYVKEGKMSDGTSFSKTPISVLRSDGTTSPLYVATDTCFSFGIQKDSKYGGYSIPLVLMDKDNPTDKQRKFVKVIKEIMSACHPTPKSCLCGKKDPIMYVKLDYDKEYDDFLTCFYERETMEDKDSTKEITPEKYIGKKNCLARVIIEISNIFVARTTTLQMRAKTIVFSELKSKPRKTESFLDEI